MSRVLVDRQNKSYRKPIKSTGGANQVARIFVPAYEDGISVNISVRQSRNSDARRKLGRMIESRRTVS
jgi:hypothetical protein